MLNVYPQDGKGDDAYENYNNRKRNTNNVPLLHKSTYKYKSKDKYTFTYM